MKTPRMRAQKPNRDDLEELILSFIPKPSDFRLQSEGSLVLLHPLTPAAVAWVNNHIGEHNGYQPQWPSVLVEPRYLGPILEGLAADGLSVV